MSRWQRLSGARSRRTPVRSRCPPPARRPASGSPSFGVAPETGAVYYVMPPGDAWFANSSIELWLRTLHHYGRHVTKSELLSEPGGPEEEYLSEVDEERTLAELARLAEELRKIDPAAFHGYTGFIWPELLDRWLY
ncbi:SUKH-4 family immunity protein [Streptomyces sp. NBC_00365]|nr:SUKH-4 family immunity protein [Streptomyces sp. NBC_00365]